MTDYQIKQMTAALKDIAKELKMINRTLSYIDKKLENNGFAVLPTITTDTTEEETNGN